jgi:hypothetical protein
MIIYCQDSVDVVRAGVLARAGDVVKVDQRVYDEPGTQREAELLESRGVMVEWVG